MIKFANDTTVVGLLKNKKTAYSAEVEYLVDWFQLNNLSLNVEKPQELSTACHLSSMALL